MYDEIVSDVRMSLNLKLFIHNCIRSNPEKVIEILVFLALFDAYDKEWLDFIVDSRAGKQPWKGFDIIEGGVANDRVIDAVEAYINGYADVEHTLRQLIYHKPNYQICILNQEIVDNQLIFQSYERV